MQFSYLFVAAFGASLVAGATIEQREASRLIAYLKTIDGDAKALLKAAQATDGSNLVADISIGTSAKKLRDDIDAAIKVAQGYKKSDITQKDAKAVLAGFEKIEPTAKAICKRLRKDKAGFQQAGIESTVADGVAEIPPRIKTIGNLVLKLAPKNYQSKAKKLLALYKEDLSVCEKAFPSK